MHHTGDLDFVGGVSILAPAPLGGLALQRFGSRNHAAQILDLVRILVQRMPGYKEAQHFFFVGQPLALFPVRNLGQIVAVPAVRGFIIEQSEQPGLPLRGILLRLLRALHRLVDSSIQRTALAQRIQRTRLDQRFDHALVHHAQVDLLAELPEDS